MVRTTIDIKLIADKSKRHTAFTKRRQGLFKKVRDFAEKFDSEAAAIAFSKAGNIYAFGHPSVKKLVDRYLAGARAESTTETEESCSSGGESEEEEEEEEEWEVERRIGEAVEKKDWSAAVEDLGVEELDEVAAEIKRKRELVAAREAEIGGSGGVINKEEEE